MSGRRNPWQPCPTKNGKPAAFMLRDDLVTELRKLVAGQSQAERVIAWVPNYRTFRRLLVAVQIPLKDATGRKLDFHALRKTYNTNLHGPGLARWCTCG